MERISACETTFGVKSKVWNQFGLNNLILGILDESIMYKGNFSRKNFNGRKREMIFGRVPLVHLFVEMIVSTVKIITEMSKYQIFSYSKEIKCSFTENLI